MKTTTQVVAFKLSVLTTLMLCISANNNASDIEIYKAPAAADGKARIMLNLDNSTFMANYSSGAQSPGSIYEDFGADMGCPSNEKFLTETEVYTSPVYSSVSGLGSARSYTFTANYCPVTVDAMNRNGAKLNRDAIRRSCIPDNSLLPTQYKCYDRFTMLKRAVFNVVNSPELGSGITLGLSYFPKHTDDGSANVKRPIPLAWYKTDASGAIVICDTSDLTDCTNGRDELSNIVRTLRISLTNEGEKIVPISQGFGEAAVGLLKDAAGNDLVGAVSCSGYGIFNLTAGSPVADNMDVARASFNSVLRNERDAQILGVTGQCVGNGSGNSAGSGVAWQCAAVAAERLAAGKTRINQKVKSVVVSFGTGFKLGLPDLRNYIADPQTTEQEIRSDLIAAAGGTNKFTGIYKDKDRAAFSGLVGGAGYYSADDTQAVTNRIVEFGKSIPEVDIPYIITGAPTIPQDPLDPVIVQSDAYYSQFKPTPMIDDTAGSRLWVGNMKKYHVTNLGRLVGKDDADVINSVGELIGGTKDFWSPLVSDTDSIKNADETVWGSELYARMGGVKSQLPLTEIVADAQIAVRKLLTNRTVDTDGVASESTSDTLTRIDLNYADNDPKRSDIMKLLELRQIGAVMHSSPLLLSNKGTLSYDDEIERIVSSNREDYVLFGTTQGVLHVVKVPDYSETIVDGETTNNGGGKEVFAFVPHEMIENQSPAFQLPDASTGGKANLYYGIDAPWTAYTEYVPTSTKDEMTVGTGKTVQVNGSDVSLQGKQFVYGGLRMGGRSYYALDLKNMNDPKLKFHINPTGTGSSSDPVGYMGESWSKPRISWVKWGGTRKLVMFVGGGYDRTGGVDGKGYENKDYNQTNKKGAGVYMFDALTGDLLWWASDNASATTAATTTSGVIALKDANMKYSVVNEIKTVDRNNDGLVDHLYFGDLAGQVFRIDINNNATTIGAFAQRSTRLLNMHTDDGSSPRFYAAPSFAIYKDEGSSDLFAGISIGSGDLSSPLVEYSVGSSRNFDALYTIYDKDVARPDLYVTAGAMNTQNTTVNTTTINDVSKLNEITSANRFNQTAASDTSSDPLTPIAPYASTAGWYFKFKGSNNKPQQEKVFYSPTAIGYDLYISSYDSSRLGLTGQCGGGVQGVSKVRLFCMPFGQCSSNRQYSNETNASDEHGPGIQNHAIAGTGNGTSRLIGGSLLSNNLSDQYGSPVKLIPRRWYER
ncbi:hypothetical protein Q674_03190 [Acinetobacter sp. COS3]|uniref:hypothetical protein n=1 Tax=Acinetobacter sp. COS3 TaxID=1397525 RepID=UPI0003B80302|nr:hypothetical protein [Acinetobacter sp. COS3]ERQ00134.1 hypothetical protein Q674_03190 [Acinetobacter sp. COS3]